MKNKDTPPCLDVYTGEVLNLKRVKSHPQQVFQANSKPYQTPVNPKTLEDVEHLNKSYGVHWHVLVINLEVKDLLHTDLTLSDIKVLVSICDGVIYNNYSSTTTRNIREEHSLSKTSVNRSLLRLTERGYIRDISEELNQIHPSLAWRGDIGVRTQMSMDWINGKPPRDYIFSEDYLAKTKETYKHWETLSKP